MRCLVNSEQAIPSQSCHSQATNHNLLATLAAPGPKEPSPVPEHGCPGCNNRHGCCLLLTLDAELLLVLPHHASINLPRHVAAPPRLQPQQKASPAQLHGHLAWASMQVLG